MKRFFIKMNALAAQIACSFFDFKELKWQEATE